MLFFFDKLRHIFQCWKMTRFSRQLLQFKKLIFSGSNGPIRSAERPWATNRVFFIETKDTGIRRKSFLRSLSLTLRRLRRTISLKSGKQKLDVCNVHPLSISSGIISLKELHHEFLGGCAFLGDGGKWGK